MSLKEIITKLGGPDLPSEHYSFSTISISATPQETTATFHSPSFIFFLRQETLLDPFSRECQLHLLDLFLSAYTQGTPHSLPALPYKLYGYVSPSKRGVFYNYCISQEHNVGETPAKVRWPRSGSIKIANLFFSSSIRV